MQSDDARRPAGVSYFTRADDAVPREQMTEKKNRSPA
jgi:hypothetical protein